MRRLAAQPLVWCWLFVAIWAGHAAVALILQRWTGLTISLLGLLAAHMVALTIQRRRNKNLRQQEILSLG